MNPVPTALQFLITVTLYNNLAEKKSRKLLKLFVVTYVYMSFRKVWVLC